MRRNASERDSTPNLQKKTSSGLLSLFVTDIPRVHRQRNIGYFLGYPGGVSGEWQLVQRHYIVYRF